MKKYPELVDLVANRIKRETGVQISIEPVPVNGKVIVHGHTVTPEPELLSNRIGIDTGAYSTGVLTCAVFENLSCKFIQTTK